MHVEKLVQPDIRREVQTPIKECEKAKHSTYADDPVLSGQHTQGGDAQRREQQDHRPVTRGVRNHFDRIGTQFAVQTFKP